MDALVETLQRNHAGRSRPSGRFWFWIDEDRSPPTMADIQRAVAESFGTSLHELLSNSQRKPTIAPRYVGMYLARRLTRQSNQRIAAAFRRDPTIVVRAIKVIGRMVAADPAFAARVAALEGRLA